MIQSRSAKNVFLGQKNVFLFKKFNLKVKLALESAQIIIDLRQFFTYNLEAQRYPAFIFASLFAHDEVVSKILAQTGPHVFPSLLSLGV